MKSNVEYLRDLLTTDEQREFLEGLIKDHEKVVESLVDEHKSIQSSLEDIVLEERKNTADHTIDTGIGKFHFSIEGSIDQQELMEAIADIIAREGVRGLLDHLRNEYEV